MSAPIRKQFSFARFFNSRRFSKVERCKRCRRVEAKMHFYRFAKIKIARSATFMYVILFCDSTDILPFEKEKSSVEMSSH